MGTRFELHAFGQGVTSHGLSTAQRAIELVDDALTIHRPSSATALNERLMAGLDCTIDDPILFETLIAADDGNCDTSGIFDIAANMRHRRTWRHVSIDRNARHISASCPIAFDFGGVGKGLALDRAAQILKDSGIRSALLSAGESSIVVVGEHPLGGAWPLCVPHPLQPEQSLVELELIDEALSISASVGAGSAAPERSVTLNATNGAAVKAPRLSVAVAPTGAMAEIVSTALLAANDDQAEQLCRQSPHARFRFALHKAGRLEMGMGSML